MTKNINTDYAEKLYEEKGEVGFWYFYKDSVTKHFKTLLQQLPSGKGPKIVVKGVAHTFIGLLMLLLIITSPIWIPAKHLRKSYAAGRDYHAWVKEEKKG